MKTMIAQIAAQRPAAQRIATLFTASPHNAMLRGAPRRFVSQFCAPHRSAA